MQKVADIYGYGLQTIHKNFKKHNLKIRSNKENSRRYEVDHNFFNNIDTEEKAYWLGFIYADGFVSNIKGTTSRKVGISLAEIDKQHLEKFNASLESTYPIGEYTVSGGYLEGVKYCRVLLTSNQLFDDLVRHGCVEHKTSILEKPNIDDKLIKHFIRGYVDGDGSITKINRECYGYEYGLNIVGTDSMLTFISEHFIDNNVTDKPIYLEKRKEEHSVSYIRYGGNFKSEVLLDYLYKDATIYLDRKYKRYLELKLQNCRTQ